MNFRRVYAMLLRYMYLMRRNFDRASDAFYWPMLDLFLWGLTAQYVDQISQNSLFLKMLLSGLIFWYIVYRIQGDITVNLLEEFWNHNLVNVFVSPLTFNEWVTSLLANGVLKGALSFLFATVLAIFLYHVHIFSIGLKVLPFAFLLMLSGWAVGFFIAGLIFRLGQKIQFLAWTMVYMLSPFSAIYYPISILPRWAQHVGAALPTSYVFEGLRQTINTGVFDPHKFYTSLGLNIIYLIAAWIFLRKSFSKALDRGLISLQ